MFQRRLWIGKFHLSRTCMAGNVMMGEANGKREKANVNV
jgi:hypothetical protein